MAIAAFPKSPLTHFCVSLLLIQLSVSCSSQNPAANNQNPATSNGTGGTDGGQASSDAAIFVDDIADDSGIADVHGCAIALNYPRLKGEGFEIRLKAG